MAIWFAGFAVLGIAAMSVIWFPQRALALRERSPWAYRCIGGLTAAAQLPFAILVFGATWGWGMRFAERAPWVGEFIEAAMLLLPLEDLLLWAGVVWLQAIRIQGDTAVPLSLSIFSTFGLMPGTWFLVMSLLTVLQR